MGIVVRRAHDADVEWLLRELRSFSRFFGSKLELFADEAHARAVVEGMVRDHVVFVADMELEAATHLTVGFIAGAYIPHPFNPGIRLLSEQFWWVDEAYRGTRAGALLLKEFLDWGKANADWITMALEAHSPVNDTSLTRRGFKLQERSFLMEVG